MIILHSILLLFYCGLVFYAIFSKRTSVAIIAYAMVSVALLMLYYSYNAADVGLTEISIGAFISFFYFYTTHSKTNIHSDSEDIIPTILYTIFIIILFCVLMYTALLLEDIVALEEYSAFYVMDSYNQTHIPNVVTVVLASYRGFDTMGETLIIATSGIGVCSILKKSTAPNK